MREIIIGIDPGVKTGMAIMHAETGQFSGAQTTDFHSLMAWADTWSDDDKAAILFVVENASGQNIYRKKYGAKEQRPGEAQARNIGMNNRESQLVVGELRRRGFEVYEYVPVASAKWQTPEKCEQFTGSKLGTNQHVRDAMRFAFECRHLARVKGRL